MNRYTFIILVTFLCNPIIARAQNQPRQQPFGNWIMYFGDNKINDKIGLHSELQLRNYFIGNTVQQTLARVGLNYYISPVSMVTGGYAFVYTRPTSSEVGGSTTAEHRIWQQLILRHRTYNIFLEHRYRLEQRFVENITTNRNIYEDRVRYRLQALFPLYNFSPYLRHYFISSYNELFMNLGKEISGQFFDRNRLYFALGYQLSPKFNLQFGYLNQVISVPNYDRPDVNHNFQISVVYNMDDLTALFTSK